MNQRKCVDISCLTYMGWPKGWRVYALYLRLSMQRWRGWRGWRTCAIRSGEFGCVLLSFFLAKVTGLGISVKWGELEWSASVLTSSNTIGLQPQDMFGHLIIH